MSGFDKRVCVVTGAGAGIGCALSLGLAQRGALMILFVETLKAETSIRKQMVDC